MVSEFDERFSYVRRDTTGGPSAARLTALERVKGEFAANLDSDNELFPWALDRGVRYLRDHPKADGAVGLFVFPDGLRVRVAGGVKLIGWAEFAALRSTRSGADGVGIFRRNVVDEWLRLRRDYFATEVVFTLRQFLSHSVVYVDEPWGRYHTAASDRVSSRPRDPRRLDDIGKFVAEFRPLIGVDPCGPLDITLISMWVLLVRARRNAEAAIIAEWMDERGISLPAALSLKLRWSLRSRLPAMRETPWVY